MFNLEQSIAEWQRQMLAGGIKSPVPSEELENHLREEIEQQMQSGLSAQQAFEIAVEKIGPVAEFKKIGVPMKITKIIKLAGVICVVVALFCQVFTCSPIVFAFLFAHGLKLSLLARLAPLAVSATTVAATILSWRYNHKLLPVIHNQLFRRSAGIVCYGGCLLWIRFALFHLPADLPTGVIGSFLLVTFLLGSQWTVMAILGGVGHGLEKAASEKSEPADLLASQS